MTDDTNKDKQLRILRKTANILIEALPFILRYDQKTVVVKFGGNAMSDKVMEDFSRDVVLMKQTGIEPVIVHGGGPQIGAMLKKLDIPSTFIDGLRVTDEATMEVVEMVLTGKINKQIVTGINSAGGHAVGLSGTDGNLIRARKIARTRKNPETGKTEIVDYGFVGEPANINPEVLTTFLKSNLVPVIAPVGVGETGETYNINADTAAGAVAASMRAERLVLLTDVTGVLDAEGNLIRTLTAEESRRLIADGTIKGGMIPKIETAIHAVESGVKAAVILDGRVPHALLLELFTEHGAGTLITAK